ncbi:hypothetical protein FR943_24180 [Mycobacterium sp. TNTM28]|uniref:Tetratricopeptide repeat protein n=1 Tax=[Mycobacterium] fortunisiensis TaxID=2600579 RepID=A0ABS6KTS6_9MYCO|nr:hypothetical protein [[Mycobacterium] fortunisiensis]
MEVLEARRATLGNDHPDTLAVAWLVASWRHNLGEAGAVEALRDLLPTMMRVLGAEHHDTLWARHTLAAIDDGATDPADRLLRWVHLCGADTRVFGVRHELTLAAAYGAALARRDLGDPYGASMEALVVYRHRLRLLGEHHPETLAARLAHVSWHGEAMGVTAKTLDDLDDLIPVLENALGHDDLTTLTARYTRAVWTQESADNQMERISEWEVLAADLARVRGEADPLTVSALERRDAARAEWQAVLEVTRDIAYSLEFEERSDDPDCPDAEAETRATDAADEEESDQAYFFESVLTAKRALSQCARGAGNDAYQTLLWRYYLGWCLWAGHEFGSAGQRARRLVEDSTIILGEDDPLTDAARTLLSFNETQAWTGLSPFWDGSDAAELSGS